MDKRWPPWDKDVFVADFHIHSRFSRATSKLMEPDGINKMAKMKGIQVVGTGDFTHPGYLKELKEKLEPLGNGLFVCRSDPEGTKFILSAEVSNIFSQGGRGRRIHTVLLAPDFETAEEIQGRLKALGNVTSDGRPIFGFPVKQLVKLVIDANPSCFVIPAHIWTPWFSLFGAKSGFDSIEECFEEETEHIYALETGLSSDPQMNWRLSQLDNYVLVSNSDAHSPWKLGREANIFSCSMDYDSIIEALKSPDKGFEGTIEFFPEEGKYHYDGHRNCNVCLSPKETKKLQGLCPVCSQPVTVGVCHRVDDLADRDEGFVPDGALPNVHLIPLVEIFADALGVKSITTRVKKQYENAIKLLGTEFEILMWKNEKELLQHLPEKVAKGILAMRREEVEVVPGYDGVYGRISAIRKEIKITASSETDETQKIKSRQKSLF